MTEQQIHYFLTLVEEQSFSKASKKLFVTQPSLSQYIMKFEKQIGAKLFDRSSVPIRLTEEGKAVYQAVCQMRSITEDLKQQINSLQKTETGSLHLGITPFRGSALLSNSIIKYHNDYPGITISIIEKSHEELLDSLIHGECDLVIDSGNINHSLFCREPLLPEKLYMAVSKQNPLNEQLKEHRLKASDLLNNSTRLLQATPCKLDQFHQQPYIIYEGCQTMRELTTKILEEQNHPLDIILKLRDMYTVFSLVVADMGVSIIPDSLIRYGNFHTHPYYYKLDSQYTINPIYLITKKNRTLTKPAYEYLKILKELNGSGTW